MLTGDTTAVALESRSVAETTESTQTLVPTSQEVSLSTTADATRQDEAEALPLSAYTARGKDQKNELTYLTLARQLAADNARQCPSLSYHIHWIYNKIS